MATVAEILISRKEDMTRAERQLSDVIMDNYPISGLGSTTELAAAAGVSTPTVARLVQKLGFAGYPTFQAALRSELGAMIQDPVTKRETWQTHLPQEHILSRYAEAAQDNIRRTLENMDLGDFDGVCGLLADPNRRVYITGGRLSSTLARSLYLHLQMIRPDVVLIPGEASWPHIILDIKPGDVFVVFDIRRYENQSLTMGEMAHNRGAKLVLFTDQWRSPLDRLADHTLAGRISVPSAWDSSMSLMLLVESLIAAVQEEHWETVKERTDALEQAFDQTRLFRKFT